MKLLFVLFTMALFSTSSDGASLTTEQKREVYFLLGMTDEYLGHPIGFQSRFYINQESAEAIYSRRAESLRASVGLGNLSEVWSLVDSFYRRRTTDEMSNRVMGEASWEMFDGNREFREDYLRGAILANWDRRDGKLRMANSGSKAHLLVDIIAELGAKENCEVQLVVLPHIPFVYEIEVRGSKWFDELVTNTLRIPQ